MTPGQFGPRIRVPPGGTARITRTMSRVGTPSVMLTASSSPASTDSERASAAKAGGTTTNEVLAPVAAHRLGHRVEDRHAGGGGLPPFPGVTPATSVVP